MYTTFDKNNQRKQRHIRIRGKISGTAKCPRVSIFRSNKYIYASLIDDTKSKTIAYVSSKNLGLDNTINTDAAKRVGEELGAKAKALKIKTAVFDRSGYLYHGRVKALADALRSTGVKF